MKPTDETKLETEAQSTGKVEAVNKNVAAAKNDEKPSHSKAVFFGANESDDQSASYECCRWC